MENKDGPYHRGKLMGYIYNTGCGQSIDPIALKWRAWDNEESVRKCDICFNQDLMEEIAE